MARPKTRKKCRTSGKTRVKPVPRWKKQKRNRRRRIRRLVKRVKRMAAEPGAPFMGFVCVLDGVVQLHGSEAFSSLLKQIGKLTQKEVSAKVTVKKTDKKVSSDVIDCRDIDPYINWDNVSGLTVLRMSYSRIVPRKGTLC